MRSPEPTPTGVRASLRRIRVVARQTMEEALRLRLSLIFLLIATGLMGGAGELRDFNFGGDELKFIGDFGLGAMGFLGTLLAVLATTQLFFREITDGTLCFVLTRSVRRWEYLAGKLAGVAALLAWFVAALGTLLGGLLLWRANQLSVLPVALPVLLCACALQWLKLTLVAALTLLLCTYAGSALFASCAGLLLAGMAHMPSWAHERAVSWLEIWPNLAMFDGEMLLAAGRVPAGFWLLQLTVYWAAYLIVLGGLSAYAFNRREF